MYVADRSYTEYRSVARMYVDQLHMQNGDE